MKVSLTGEQLVTFTPVGPPYGGIARRVAVVLGKPAGNLPVNAMADFSNHTTRLFSVTTEIGGSRRDTGMQAHGLKRMLRRRGSSRAVRRKTTFQALLGIDSWRVSFSGPHGRLFSDYLCRLCISKGCYIICQSDADKIINIAWANYFLDSIPARKA